MDEWVGVAARYYDYFSTGLPGDVEFYVEEARKVGSPVLELGCGTGRILIELAKASLEVAGLDRSPDMLAIAERKLADLDAEVRQRVELVQGDMRAFSLGREFKLIAVPYRAFLHLMSPADERQALACIRDHLADDGRLVLNVFDPRLDLIAAHDTPLGSALKKHADFVHPDTGIRVVVWESWKCDPGRQIVEEDRIVEEIDERGRTLSRTHTPLRWRYVFRQEMEYLLEIAGFKVEALYDDFQRGPYRYGKEQIWIAGKG